jgi:hypothetical protein
MGSDAPFEVENLCAAAEPEPQLMAAGAIDLDEVASPEILDPCQVHGLHHARSRVPEMSCRTSEFLAASTASLRCCSQFGGLGCAQPPEKVINAVSVCVARSAHNTRDGLGSPR